MMENVGPNVSHNDSATDVKSWVIVALTFIFVALYVVALAGFLKPLDKTDMLTRLEPIIFVIIGYYFGRLPAQQVEKSLKNEAGRQQQKADAAEHTKEKALQERDVLEEKVKNVVAVLDEAPHVATDESTTASPANSAGSRRAVEAATVRAAVKILKS